MASSPNTDLVCVGPVNPTRQSTYTFEVSEDICERIAAGELLQDICKDDDMPCERTVSRWILADFDDFGVRYARAREIQSHLEADQTRSIADDPDIAPEHKRIMVDARKWRAERLNRRTYGNSVQHQHSVQPPADTLAPGGIPRALVFLDRRSGGDGDDGNPVDS